MFIIIIFSSFLFTSSFAWACPDGSLEWKSNCYFFNSIQIGFAKAETECVKIGGHLTSIHDAFTNNIIRDYSPEYFSQNNTTDFWIGGNSMTSANIWEWSDNSKFDFIDWAKGEPSKNSSDLKCISLSMLDGYWRAQNCLNSKPYVCVIPKQYFTKTTPSSPISNCSKGWIYFEPTNSCYAIFSPNQLPDHDWQWAENYCLTFGAHTPSIHSEDEQAFLHGYVHEYDDSAWLGLYSIDNGTTWQYTDNTPVDYLQWGIREPNIIYGERNCVISTTDRKSQLGWFEVTSCNSILMTACKKPRN